MGEDVKIFLSWAFDRTPPAGREERARHDYYNLRDRVPCLHFPLALYIAMMLLQMCVSLLLWLLGFRKHQHGQLRYWVRGLDDAKPMNVFLHGMGMGFTLYLGLILGMDRAPLLMIDMPWVGFSLWNFVWDSQPAPEDFLQDYCSIMEKHGIKSAVHVAHSYGNGVLSQILQDPLGRTMVSRCVCIDPVCMHNFRSGAH